MLADSETEQVITMFDAKNNWLLDNLYFQLFVKGVAFTLWLGATYALLAAW